MKTNKTLNVSKSLEQQYLSLQFLSRMIADIYVWNMVIYHLFIDSGISRSNSQHSMFALFKGYNELMYTEKQNNFPDNYLIIFSNSQQFCHCCQYLSYIQHQISDSPFTFGRTV